MPEVRADTRIDIEVKTEADRQSPPLINEFFALADALAQQHSTSIATKNEVLQAHEQQPNQDDAKMLSTWQTESFYTRWQLARLPETRQQILQDFSLDIGTYYDEYARAGLALEYPSYGPNGVNNTYSERISDGTKRAINRQKEARLPTTRAEIDHRAALAFEEFIGAQHSAVGQKLVFISTRAHPNEGGYPGVSEKNYVFVNVYEKKADGTARFTQFRSFDTTAQSKSLQEKLLTPSSSGGFDGAIFQTSRHARPNISEQRHAVADRLIVLPSSVALTDLTPHIYQHSDEWYIQPQEFAQVDATLYYDKKQEVSATLEGIFIQIVKNNQQQLLPKFNQLVTLYVRDSFKKWIDFQATNYTHERQPHAITAESIIAMWQQLTSTDAAEVAELQEQRSTWKLSIYSPMNRISSIMQCSVGSLRQINPTFNATMGANSLSLRLNPSTLASLERNDQLSLLKEALASGYVLVDLRADGAQKVFLVPPKYMEGLGCDVIDKRVVGPCADAGNPALARYNHRIPLDDPRDTLALEVPLELIEQLQEATASLDSMIKETVAPADRDEAKKLIKKLYKLIAGPVKRFSHLIAGIEHAQASSIIFTEKIATILRESDNPLQTLQTLVSEMENSSGNSAENQLDDLVVQNLFNTEEIGRAVLHTNTTYSSLPLAV